MHYATQTVREAIMFSMLLRLPPGPPEAKFLRLKSILHLLKLTHQENSLIGGQTLRGISGGEKRRLSIACEAASGGGILIADSPTNVKTATSIPIAIVIAISIAFAIAVPVPITITITITVDVSGPRLSLRHGHRHHST